MRNLQLPAATPSLRRGLIKGSETGVYFDHQRPTKYEKHTNDHVQIMLLFESSSCDFTWRIPGGRTQRETLRGAQLCILAPGVVHEVSWKAEASLVVLFAAPAFLRRFGEHKKLRGVHTEPFFAFARKDMLAWQLVSVFRGLCEEEGEIDREFVIAIGRVLVARLLEYHFESLRTGGRKERFSRSQLRQVTDHMDLHADRPIEIREMAELLGMSRSHFMRMFKNTVGTPAAQYHMVRRLHKAEEALLRTNASVADIVAKYGFYDESHINRCFRKHLRYLPRALLAMRDRLPIK